MKKIALFWKLPSAGKRIFLEVLISSLYTAYLLRNDKHQQKITDIMNRSPFKGDTDRQPEFRRRKIIQFVSSAIQTIAKYTPWRNVCYHQALQAKLLLNRRGIPTKVYIGFKKNDRGAIEGHAWTKYQDKIITGFCNTDEYIVLSEFQ